MQNQKIASRLFGIFFILTFLAYGIGSAMVAAVTEKSGFLADLSFNSSTLFVGVILMAVVHTVLNIGLAAIMYGVLAPVNRLIAAGYFGLAIVATTVLVIGAVFLLLLLPLHDQQSFSMETDILAILVKRGAFYCYQLGMAIWGLGGLALVFLLYRSQIVPRILSVFGALGYAIFVVGTISEISGIGNGVAMSLPGGLFEISLSVWLIVKGFSASASPVPRFAAA